MYIAVKETYFSRNMAMKYDPSPCIVLIAISSNGKVEQVKSGISSSSVCHLLYVTFFGLDKVRCRSHCKRMRGSLAPGDHVKVVGPVDAVEHDENAGEEGEGNLVNHTLITKTSEKIIFVNITL